MSHVPTVREIQTKVAKFHGISPVEMKSHRKHHEFVRPRQIAMYLSRQLTRHSFHAIAREFGGRDHKTATNAWRAVGDLARRDAGVAIELAALRSELTRGPASTFARARQACRERRKEIERSIEKLRGTMEALERAEAALDEAATLPWPSSERLTALVVEILRDE